MKKRTYKFDEFQNKIEEGFDNIGFRPIQEEEEESIDDLGKGEEVKTEEQIPEPEQTNIEDIDTGEATTEPNFSVEEIRVKTKFIVNQINSLKDLVNNADDVPLDDETKQKIMNIYNVLK